MTIYSPGVVVPAIPPKPGPLSLVNLAIDPTNTSDPSNPVNEITAVQQDMLPADLAADLAARQGDSWIRGFQYLPESQTAIHVKDPSDDTDDGLAGSDLSPPINIVVPYMLEAVDTASTFGFEGRDFEGRARRKLENGKGQAIAREFWAGTLATAKSYPNRFLADSNCVDVTPGTVPDLLGAYALLAQQLAQGPSSLGMGGQGMIHCIPRAVPETFWAVSTTGLLTDLNGNIIVPDDGYPGTGPNGNANKTPPAGQTWLYATDLVMVREEAEAQVFADTFSEMTDIGQGSTPNTIYYRARKMAAAYFDGYRQFACRATLPT